MEKEIKKFEISNRLFIAFLILVLGVLTGILAGIVYKFWPPQYREISVSAEGRVFVKPDVALINLGAKTEAWNVKTVIKENTEKMNLILTELKNLGIAERDIQTTKYNLEPRYEYLEKGERIFKGYVLENEIRVKIRDFEKIGEVLEKATEKGANLIGNLSFSIDDSEEARAKAREVAIKRAKEKAEKIARQSGIKLKKLVNIYEEYSYYPIERVKKEMTVPLFEIAPEIQPGELEVKVQVSLVYQI